MNTKIYLKVSVLSDDEIVDTLDDVVKCMELRYDPEDLDTCFCELAATNAKRLYGEGKSADSYQQDEFSIDVHVCDLKHFKKFMTSIFECIEYQLGAQTGESIFYQVMYRLGVRMGKYSDLETDSDSESSDDYINDKENSSQDWHPTSSEKNSMKPNGNQSLLDNIDDDINKANEEREMLKVQN